MHFLAMTSPVSFSRPNFSATTSEWEFINRGHAFAISDNTKDKKTKEIEKSLNRKEPKENSIFLKTQYKKGQRILIRVHLLHMYFIPMLMRKMTTHIASYEVHPMNPTLSKLLCTYVYTKAYHACLPTD